MYALDNNSGVSVRPEIKSQVFSADEPRWFTEGGSGVAPSYPGADWFNIVQAELLNVLRDGGIQPDKTKLDQITTAIHSIVANAVSGKANASHSHAWSDITNKPSTFSPASHTHTMANITDLAAAMNAKANLASPTFTGAPKAPTPAQTVNDTTIATTAFVKTAIAALVGSAPAALDTLAEIATALGSDANLKQTLLAEIGKKANASHNHTMSQITDFELKQLSTEDLDTVKKAGMYKQQDNANATTARHYPETQAGALLVMPSTYGWMQIYIAHGTYRIYIRNANNSGGWLSWVRMDGRDKLNSSDFTNFKNLLVGIPFPYPLAAVPSGCLAFNGQAFNKTTYPILAQKYPSGVLPDLRGEFIRGWDNGRNIDRDRQILSAQGDAIRNIKGELKSTYGTTEYSLYTIGTGAFTLAGAEVSRSFAGEGISRRKSAMAFDASLVVPTANENRPRNIAFQYICLAA